MSIQVRQATQSDWTGIRRVLVEAFGPEEGDEIVNLTAGLLAAGDASPRHSMVAVEDDAIVGHILFTRVQVGAPAQEVSASLLAPLSVLPDFQQGGIGGRLVSAGIDHLKASDVDLVFVLGHPNQPN